MIGFTLTGGPIMKTREQELEDALKAALEWIDAVPAEVRAALPAMPGFDRDDVDSLLSAPSIPFTNCKVLLPAKEAQEMLDKLCASHDPDESANNPLRVLIRHAQAENNSILGKI
jgi:hypothetical protein